MIHPRISTVSKVLRETVNGWVAVPTDEIRDYCLHNEAAAGSFLELCGAAPSVSAQLRLAAGSTRRLLSNAGPSRSSASHQRATVIAHIRPGDRHAVVWLPIVRDLLRAGLSVGCTDGLDRWRGAPEQREPSDHPLSVARISEPRGGGSRRSLVARALRTWATAVPWRGAFGASAALAIAHTEALTAAWTAELRRLGTSVVVTTAPYSSDGHPLLLAARGLGISTVCIQVGLANNIVWPLVVCEGAVVWSALGEQELRRSGWGSARIQTAACPTIPSPLELRELRETRRRQLGVGPHSRCVLFIGQRTADQGFVVRGYRETVAMVAEAFGLAGDSGVVPLIRPHVSDAQGETESLLAKAGLRSAVISRNASLFADIAAADLAVSMHSAALEEAFLAGVPIVQAVPAGFPPVLDFGCIGARLARTPRQLADTVTSSESAVPAPRATLSAADAIRSFIHSETTADAQGRSC